MPASYSNKHAWIAGQIQINQFADETQVNQIFQDSSNLLSILVVSEKFDCQSWLQNVKLSERRKEGP